MKPSKLIKVIAKDLAFLGGEMSAEIKGFSLGTRLDIEAFSKANKSFRRIFDLDRVRVEKGNVQEYKAESSIIYGGMPAIYGIKTLKKDFGVQEITATVCYFDEGQDSPLEDIVLLSDGTSISTKTPLKCSTFAHNYTNDTAEEIKFNADVLLAVSGPDVGRMMYAGPVASDCIPKAEFPYDSSDLEAIAFEQFNHLLGRITYFAASCSN